jgi:hypothetical protein
VDLSENGDNRAILQLADELASMKGRVDLLEDGSKANQLKFSSLENGSIAVYDAAGLERLRLGLQPDGTFTSSSKNNPDPPPIPKPPLLTAGKGTVRIQSQGSVRDDGSWPADFSHLKVHAQVQGGLQQYVGTIAVDPGVYVLGPLDYVPIEVWFTAVNHSGKESANSLSATVTPEKLVGDDLLAGTITSLQLAREAVQRVHLALDSVTEFALADDAVTHDAIAAHAIDAEQIRANAITAYHIMARTITGLQIEVDTILGEHIAARTIDAEKLVALSITANEIAANSVTAAKIVAGSVTADKLQAVLVLATQIIAGDPTGGRVALGSSGIDAFNPGGERTFQLDKDGNVRLVGIVESGIDGSIVRISPGDPNSLLQVPGIFLYADNSTYPAMIWSTPQGQALGVTPSTMNLAASLDDTAGTGHISLRDQGVQFGYDRLFGINGSAPDLRPVGGSVQITETQVDARMQSVDGLQNSDGGILNLTRDGASIGAVRGTTNALLMWTVDGLMTMRGGWFWGDSDPNCGYMIGQFTLSTAGGTYINWGYGTTITGWTRRLISGFIETANTFTPRYCYVINQNATSAQVGFSSAAASGDIIHLTSTRIG